MGAGEAAVPTAFADVCPFSGYAADEDVIAEELFACERGQRDDGIGTYVATYAGHATDPKIRGVGSSGGLTTWLLCAAMGRGLVDRVIHVSPVSGEALFAYTVSETEDAVRRGAKSRYYPVEMSRVLQSVRTRPGRYAIVGIPCFIKAVNLLRREDRIVAERIVLTVGIFCGHLKSAMFAEYLAVCLGQDLRDAETVDFRKKYADGWASNYGFEVTLSDGRTLSRRMSDIYGGNWGYGFFKYEACDFCDDVAAETADVSFGDAWLPEYVTDPCGTNVVVVRTRAIDTLFAEGVRNGELALNTVDVSCVVESQAAGLRDRREGLAYRLAKKSAAGEWAPRKRVALSTDVPQNRRKIYDLRMEIARTTHGAFETGISDPLTAFEMRVRPLTDCYDRLYRQSFAQRLRDLLRWITGKIWRTLKYGSR